jgi:hypothetical protein
LRHDESDDKAGQFVHRAALARQHALVIAFCSGVIASQVMGG